jgi:hypothetical protein
MNASDALLTALSMRREGTLLKDPNMTKDNSEGREKKTPTIKI